MTSKPTLYTHFESGNSYKVRLLAALLGVEITEVEIDIITGQHKSAEYLAVNPRGTLPGFTVRDRCYTDSSAMLIYLAGTHSTQYTVQSTASYSYWASDAEDQASIVDWLAFAASWIHTGLASARAIVCFGRPLSLQDAQKRGYESLEILEKQLQKNNWLVNERPTIADIACFPYVALAPMAKMSLSSYPAVLAWTARIKELPGFITMKGLDDPFYRKQ